MRILFIFRNYSFDSKTKCTYMMNFYWTGSAAGSKIFEIIRNQGPISRADISKITNQSRSTLSLQVETLLKIGLIEEEPVLPDIGSERKRRTHLKLSENLGYLISIFIGLTHLKVAICDVKGNILLSIRETIAFSDGPQVIMDLLFRKADELLRNKELTINDLLGVGIGIPGPIDFEKGVIFSPIGVVSSWNRYPIKARFEEKYQCPVLVNNDVHAMALGEKHAGYGRNHENFIMVKIATGIGASIVANGELLRGTKGSAGFISHNQVGNDQTPCVCGNVGCLEIIAGGAAISRMGIEAIYSGASPILADILQSKSQARPERHLPRLSSSIPEMVWKSMTKITAEDVGQAADMGDKTCMDIIKKSGQTLGASLAQLVNVLNPSLVVFAGGMTNLGEKLLANIREVIYSQSLPLATSDLDVKLSKLGGNEGLIGASCMVLDEIFSFENITSQIEAHKVKK